MDIHVHVKGRHKHMCILSCFTLYVRRFRVQRITEIMYMNIVGAMKRIPDGSYGSGPVMSNVECSGTENWLFDCSYDTPTPDAPGCFIQVVVELKCRLGGKKCNSRLSVVWSYHNETCGAPCVYKPDGVPDKLCVFPPDES